jgi:hypothetical protein
MGRNKLSKALEKVAREKGLIGERLQVASGETVSVVRFDMAPSTNNLFITSGRRRVKSPDYRAWIEANTAEAKRLAKPSKYPVRVCWSLCGKVNQARDGANTEKAATDLLVSVGVLAGDSLKYVAGERWDYRPSDEPEYMLVWLEEIE